MALHEGVVGDVLHEHGLANAVWPNKDGILAVLDERETEEFLDGLPIDVAGPRPIEPVDGLEGPDSGMA